MQSTMYQGTLSIGSMLDYGRNSFPKAKVFSYYQDFTLEHTFAQIAERSGQLAGALASLGVGHGDPVATFCFNHNQHLEAYFGVPSMGAVLHTLNIRLFPDQLRFVIQDAKDRVIIVDNVVASMVMQVIGDTRSVEHLVVIGPVVDPALPDELARVAPWVTLHDYEELIGAQPTQYRWPDLDETEAALMCYTSGTTGNPKGVVYSHRSTYLHTMMSLPLYSGSTLDLIASEADRALIIVPMFHANAWGAPFACWLTGSQMIMPTRFLQAAPLADIIATFRPTVASGVPTIWNDLFHYLEDHPVDMSSFRWITSGGSATPRALIEGFLERYNLPLMSGWGMTETSPICTLAIPPVGTPRERLVDYFETAGRAVVGVQLRIVGEDGGICAHDGVSIGEVQVRGPWITSTYFGVDDPTRFDEGWLRTGDMGTVDVEGYLRIVDRTKDVIKSGGEWISTIELENALMAHENVLEAAVIGVPDEKWFERPLALIVLRPGAQASPSELREFLISRVAKWWLPERFSFVKEIPKTSVGKFDKKVLRRQVEEGSIVVVRHDE
ncbi:MAG: long-chain fatty acid--CoA ligase [Ferrimicrobium sp.]